MIKVKNKIYNEATTYDYDNLIIDKRRDSIKIVCKEDITQIFDDGVVWYKDGPIESEEDVNWVDMSDYSKCVFKGHDVLLDSYVVVMSKPTEEEDLQQIIDMLVEV